MAIKSAKARSLLAYLALYPQANHGRERLADLLWPEAPPGRSLRLLSNLLYQLKQILGEGWLIFEGKQVHLAPQVQVDAHEFDHCLRQAEPAAWQRAAGLYSDDLAPDLYDEWLLAPRLEQREAWLGLLDRLAQERQHSGDLNAALHYARLLTASEPLREENQAAYLRLLGRLGRRGEALAHYDYLCELLQKELDIAPLPETQAIAAAIRREIEENAPAPPPSEHLPFVGRSTQRAALVHSIEQVLAGHGGLVVIEGEAGIGRSRLLREAAASAQWRGLQVGFWTATGSPATPLAPLANALEPLLSPARRARLEALLSPNLLSACAPLYPAWESLADLPLLPPEHQQRRLRHALRALFSALAQLDPILLVIDDAHQASSELWSALDSLVELLPTERLLLWLAYRRTKIENGVGWPLLQAWERQGRLQSLALQALSEGEIAQLLPLAERPNSRAWLHLTGGSPFWLEQALNALEERGVADIDIAARLETLPSQARHVLECAAVLAEDAAFLLLARLAGVSPYELAESAEVLAHHYLLQIVDQGYAFNHPLLQQAIYDLIPAPRRRDLHAEAARALAEMQAVAELQTAAEMQAVAELLNNLRSRARHLEMSGQPGEAAVVYQQVARQALASSAYTVGRSALQRALALLPPEPSILRAETLLELAQVNFILDEGEHQAMLIGEAQQIAATLDHAELRTRAALAAAEWATKTGDDQNAAEALHQARSLAHQTGLPHLEAEALYLSGDLALRLGQLPEARARYEQQLAVAQQARLRDQQAAALEGIGYVLADSGGADDQVFSYLHAALEIRRELGDRYREAQATNSLLSVLQAAGRLDEALLMGEQALALNQEIGYVRGAAIVRGNLAMSAAALGEFERARSLINAVRTYFMEVDDLDAVGLYTDTLGWIEERSGHLELAESLLREAIARLEASGASFFAALAKLDLGHLYVRQERYTEARPLLEGAITVFEANQAAMELERCRALLGLALLHDDQPAQAAQLAETSWQVFQSGAPQGEERQYYLWALWQLLQAVGRSQPAQIILEEAYQTLLRQAALLDDLAARQGFFQNVPVNHEISLAWQQQQGHVCQIKMRLACLSAPLGRPLTEADTIEIGWTVVAPEDETIPDKGERRLHVLRRLLSQAARQGAAPTDDDLAEALGVSRRTILRDMQILEAQGVARPTRKRKTTGE